MECNYYLNVALIIINVCSNVKRNKRYSLGAVYIARIAGAIESQISCCLTAVARARAPRPTFLLPGQKDTGETERERESKKIRAKRQRGEERKRKNSMHLSSFFVRFIARTIGFFGSRETIVGYFNVSATENDLSAFPFGAMFSHRDSI